MEVIRILHITGGMNIGGIENFIMNIYRNIDRNKIQFDFLIHQNDKQVFEDEIIRLGGRIYRIDSITKLGHFKYLKVLREFFKKHKEYETVHSHYNALSGIILREARKVGIKNRIAHSHTAYPKYGVLEGLYKNYSKGLLKKYATQRLACSKEAGEWLYGKSKEFKIIPNGIEVKKFIFDKDMRKEIHKKFSIKSDSFSMIILGRLSKEKNHIFLLDIMEKLMRIDKKIILYIVGIGPLEEELKYLVKERKIENIKFLGLQKDTFNLLNGMDLMLLPSIYEGLGIVAIEAQSNGIMVLASENIPNKADMGLGLIKRIKLSDKDKWVEEILKIKSKFKRENNTEQKEKVLKSEYNMEQVIKEVEKLYLECYFSTKEKSY